MDSWVVLVVLLTLCISIGICNLIGIVQQGFLILAATELEGSGEGGDWGRFLQFTHRAREF